MMTNDGRYAELQASLHAAVSKAINDHEEDASYLTRFVVLAEVVDSEGDRALWQVAADGMKRWDTLGLLDHARSVEYASTSAETSSD